MIVIHQMGMCPELYLDLSLDKDLPALRALAFVLNRYRRSSKFTGPGRFSRFTDKGQFVFVAYTD